MYGNKKLAGLLLGPFVFVLVLLLPPPEGMTPAGLKVAALTMLMAIWWISEAVPIPATSLLPIAVLPAMGVMPTAEATAPYANHLIFLFMGGFFLAVTMEHWNLHRRVALFVISLVGTSPARIVLGFMLATGVLSMWVSNTATAMMMVPIGMAVFRQTTGLINPCDDDSMDARQANFGKALMLGIAYAASIGGVGTIIGTPPNTVMVAMMDKLYKQQIGFFQWMLFGVPLAAVMLFLCWLLLTKILFPVGRGDDDGSGGAHIKRELKMMGPMSKEEKSILAVVVLVSTCWIIRGVVFDRIPALRMMSDANIAIIGAMLLFLIPSDLKKGKFLLDWRTAVGIPWSVILLFGGGLSLANSFSQAGLANWVALQLAILENLPFIAFVGIVAFITVFLTSVTSNTATATLLVPILGSASVALGIHPLGAIISGCVAASFAFMLPVSTPPNAVVFSSGCVTIQQMAKSGIWLNIIGTIAITLAVVYLLPLVWGVDFSVMPDWATAITE
ncbi:DASS family sodium-coupled anion symporter [bacterium]|nr:DASS family sodium-coupled anion symporter [candidate division CSSED10-310 bacterium]